MLVTVAVTDRHIEQGIDYNDPCKNAVALALKDVCKPGIFVKVGSPFIFFDNGYQEQEIPMPDAVEDYFMDETFSQDNFPDSFEFQLDIDDRYLK